MRPYRAAGKKDAPLDLTGSPGDWIVLNADGSVKVSYTRGEAEAVADLLNKHGSTSRSRRRAFRQRLKMQDGIINQKNNDDGKHTNEHHETAC